MTTTGKNPSLSWLVVDLDGTLCIHDTFQVALFKLLQERPGEFLACIAALPGAGWVAWKRRIFGASRITAGELFWNRAVRDEIEKSRRAGHRVALVTATPDFFAQEVGRFLACFDVVRGSTDRNLKGAAKAAFIKEMTQGESFGCLGDNADDLAVWAEADWIGIAGTPYAIKRLNRRIGKTAEEFPASSFSSQSGVWWRALRPHQWAKNLLVFTVLLASHEWNRMDALVATLECFAIMCVVSSGVYLINDAFDVLHDSRHPRKQLRPVTAGAVSPGAAFATGLVLLLAGVAVSAALSSSLALIVGAYALVAVAYSFKLKQAFVVDVFALVSLYLARIYAGGFGTQIVPSNWLNTFSVFAFFSLALVKRASELARWDRGSVAPVAGRAYQVTDLAALQAGGIGSGLVAALVLALYFDSPAVRSIYRHPSILWLCIPAFLFWIMRLWLMVNRTPDVEDPISFVLRDRTSLAVGVGIAAIVLLAL